MALLEHASDIQAYLQELALFGRSRCNPRPRSGIESLTSNGRSRGVPRKAVWQRAPKLRPADTQKAAAYST